MLNYKLDASEINEKELLDCFSSEEIKTFSRNKNENIVNRIECTSISTDLSNCTCTNDYIDCTNKGFFSVPTDLSKMPNTITRLFFSRNRIISLDKLELDTNSQISAIDLRENKIRSINANGFFNQLLANSLNYLSMCGNVNLNDFNSVEADFPNLHWLELNHIHDSFRINEKFFNKEKFPSLIRLSLNSVGLESEKQPFDRLDKLEVLRLDNNKLTQLPCESFMQMLSLTSLNLNSNFLSKNPDVSQDCLKNSMELSELHLQDNELAEDDLVWMNLEQFKKLSKLDLSKNKFSQIPYTALKGVRSMKSLKITIDQEEFTEPSLSADHALWPNLRYLDLSGSKIKTMVNNSFKSVSRNISDLILRDCHLKRVEPDAFGKLNNLISLDLSINDLKTLLKPSSLSLFNYDVLRGNVNLTNNNFHCSEEIEWFINFYDYELFDRDVSCYLLNGTRILVYDFIVSNQTPPTLPKKANNYNMLAIILLVLIVLVIAMGATYIVKRKQTKQRQQQYRYRYFTERSQDDGFDTDNVPVYRDCTVSLRIKDTDEVTSNSNNPIIAEQLEVIS